MTDLLLVRVKGSDWSSFPLPLAEVLSRVRLFLLEDVAARVLCETGRSLVDVGAVSSGVSCSFALPLEVDFCLVDLNLVLERRVRASEVEAEDWPCCGGGW